MCAFSQYTLWLYINSICNARGKKKHTLVTFLKQKNKTSAEWYFRMQSEQLRVKHRAALWLEKERKTISKA